MLPPLVFLVFAAVAFVGLRRENPGELPSALVGQPAPELGAHGGAARRSAADRGGPAAPGVKLVNFWASWCGPCRVEHPLLTALAEEGIPVIGINYKDTPAKALGFLDELGDPYAQDRRRPERADGARLGDLRGAGDLRGRAGRDDPAAVSRAAQPGRGREAHPAGDRGGGVAGIAPAAPSRPGAEPG